ncbi:autotransporter-associated beta strand repeat-containing protein [Luteolibacter sp. SL250]|uniref:beta strand repeat-containing protein n=1 Tax=Luteolibacter sp. SL250 TaxID=2995170 RepID=UPI00226DF854|nr:autotransporter-associated beta strand repeat-containing protein [Luteolibacter sp. SL250]WAC20001.1 autotransporter-associated beta strand repeat-containing protein [Luteolibacter sp. SL250]
MKPPRRFLFQNALVPAGAVLAGLSVISSAETLYWDTNGAADGSSSTGSGGGANGWGPHSVWSTSALGNIATVGYTQGSDVVFSAGTNATSATQTVVRINGAQSANSITFEEGTITLSSGNANGDFLNGGGSLSIGAGGITMADGLNGTATIAGGLGTLVLEASQTWTNNTTTTARQLVVDTAIAGSAGTGDTATLTLAGTGTAESTLTGVIGNGANGGTLAITKTGASIYLLSGTAANTYTGLTTVSGGVLGLNKTAGVNAITGNVSITSGTLDWRQHNQMADTSTITTSGGRINFNSRAETLDSITLGGGNLDTGNQGASNVVTVTNSVSMSNGAKLTVNSGGRISVGSLAMAGGRQALNPTTGGNILIGGNSTAVVSTLTVGAGGLSMSGQDIQFNLTGSGGLGSQIVLNGDFTGSGTNNIGYGTGAGSQLSSIQLGSATRSLNITDGTTTIGVPVGGTGSVLNKDGGGLLVLTGDNTYTGLTSINSGAVRIYHNNALGSSSGGTEVAAGSALGLYNSITVTGETLKLTGVSLASSSSAGLVNGGGDNVWTGNVTLDVGVGQNVRISSNAGTLDIQGDVFIDGGTAAAGNFGLVMTGGGGVATISGDISAAGNNQNLIKNGSSTWILSGNNTYNGITRVDDGVLGVSSIASNLGSSSDPVNLGENTATGILRYLGSGETVTRGFLLRSGTTGGGGIEQAGTGTLTIAGNITSNNSSSGKTLTLSGSTAGTGEITGNITNSGNSATSVTKSGTGTWRLSGAGNTYTGTTTVNGGTLIAASSLNTSTSLSVTGGTFAYGANDVIGNAVPVTVGAGGVIQMNGFSDALGVLAVTGSVELALGGGNSVVTFGDSSSADWTGGILSITGWSGLAAGGGDERVSFVNQGLTTDQRGRVFFVDPAGFAAGTYDAVFVGNELVPGNLIPEPSAVLLAAAGLGSLAIRRKRSARNA